MAWPPVVSGCFRSHMLGSAAAAKVGEKDAAAEKEEVDSGQQSEAEVERACDLRS